MDEKSIIRNSRRVDCEILVPGQTKERGWILPSGQFIAIRDSVGHGIIARCITTNKPPRLPVHQAIKTLLESGVVRKASWSAYELYPSGITLVEDDLLASGLFGEAVLLDVWIQGRSKHFEVGKGWESLKSFVSEN